MRSRGWKTIHSTNSGSQRMSVCRSLRALSVSPHNVFRLAAVADRQGGNQVLGGVQGGCAANRENTSQRFTGHQAGFWRTVGLPSHPPPVKHRSPTASMLPAGRAHVSPSERGTYWSLSVRLASAAARITAWHSGADGRRPCGAAATGADAPCPLSARHPRAWITLLVA